MDWNNISYRFRKIGFTVVEWIFILALVGYICNKLFG